MLQVYSLFQNEKNYKLNVDLSEKKFWLKLPCNYEYDHLPTSSEANVNNFVYVTVHILHATVVIW